MNLNDLTPWGLLALLVVNLIALFRFLTPKAWDALITRKEQLYNAERQDEIAYWSNIILWQKEMTKHYNNLIELVTKDFKNDLEKIIEALSALDLRVQKQSREIEGISNRITILTSEVSHLSEIMSKKFGKNE